jgi:hypothetical protein
MIEAVAGNRVPLPAPLKATAFSYSDDRKRL